MLFFQFHIGVVVGGGGVVIAIDVIVVVDAVCAFVVFSYY
jgi:hypothetical protein